MTRAERVSGGTQPRHLSKKLSDPLPTRAATFCAQIRDAPDYLLTLSSHRQTRNHWQHVCQLMLEEAEWRQLRADFKCSIMDSDLDIAAFQRMDGRPRPKRGPPPP